MHLSHLLSSDQVAVKLNYSAVTTIRPYWVNYLKLLCIYFLNIYLLLFSNKRQYVSKH